MTPYFTNALVSVFVAAPIFHIFSQQRLTLSPTHWLSAFLHDRQTWNGADPIHTQISYPHGSSQVLKANTWHLAASHIKHSLGWGATHDFCSSDIVMQNTAARHSLSVVLYH